MSERDLFEARFHAAVRGYCARVHSELDAGELAHRIAVAKPRRSGPAAATLVWRGLPIPRLVWALMLVAGLLAVTLGGMLLAGSRPLPALPAVVPPLAPAFTCPTGSNPDVPGPAGQARPPMGSAEAMAFDRNSGRIVLLVAPEDEAASSETWTFDLCANSWTRMQATGGPASWSYRGSLVYDSGSDLTIGFLESDLTTGVDGVTSAWAYDLDADRWDRMSAAPTKLGSFVYDPVADLVIASDESPVGLAVDLWSYDVDVDEWTLLQQRGIPPAWSA